MIQLVLEASTYAGSVAVLRHGECVAERLVTMRGRDREALMPAVAEAVAEAGCPVTAVEQVVCGAGPGSFTSLRIAGGIAKGIAVAAGAALVPVSSLALIVASVELRRPGGYLAAQDALRGEHYAQLFRVGEDGTISADGPVLLLPSADAVRHAESIGARLVGPGQASGDGVVPQARAAVHLTKMIEAERAADLASWEPAYGRLAEAQVKWEAVHGRPLVA